MLALVTSAYVYSHVFFASNISHVSAMFASFLAIALAGGAPPFVAAMLLCSFSNTFGGLTHYGVSTAPLLFGEGYCTLREWLTAGFAVSVLNLAVFGIVGPLWWRAIGLW